MKAYEAVMICETGKNAYGGLASEKTQLIAWQLLLDSGVVWKLWGSNFEREAIRLIGEGLIDFKEESQ